MTYLRTHTNTQFPLAVAAVAGFAVAVSIACASCSADDCSDSSTCNSPDNALDAGPQQDSGPIIPEGCDPAADVKDAPNCVVNAVGVFVDATGGSDSNPGTKEAPVNTTERG